MGNITVGGTGKTPLVVAIVEHLQKQGLNPGIVSRGYCGKATHWPQAVNEDSDPALVGDEARLLVQRCQCPMSVGPDRPQAARALLDKHACDVIISDDGLQHYAMHRDIEVVVVDGVRRFGNKRCLPAGPLRKPVQRIKAADYVVVNGMARSDEIEMTLQMQAARSLTKIRVNKDLADFVNQSVHAIAGIGNPNRFFSQLKSLGINVIEHPFKDHHKYSASDICFNDELPVLMTEKDAVKCLQFAQHNHWYIPVVAEINNGFLEKLTEQLRRYNG